MMFREVKWLYFFTCLGIGLVILSPVLFMIIQLPEGVKFSEIWILGPNHALEDYPFTVKEGQNYSVYLGAGNHIGGLSNYRIYAKFGNETDPLPDAEEGIPSPLSPLYERHLILQNEGTWETLLSFSFSGTSFNGNTSFVNSVVIDGYESNVSISTSWNEMNSGYYYQIFFELWIYDEMQENFVFGNQYACLKLNMTSLME
jgi:hypothetical protein